MQSSPEAQSRGHYVAEFYAQLAQSIVGGELSEDGKNNPDTGNPDLIMPNHNQVAEIKGSHRSDRVMMRFGQLDKYRRIESTGIEWNGRRLEQPEVYYMTAFHGVKPVKSLSEDELLDGLRTGTELMLALSFDIIQAGEGCWGVCHPTTWQPFVQFHATARRRLVDSPITELAALGLNPQEYIVTQERVAGKRYKGKRIAPFTWMSIRGKGHRGLEYHATYRN